MNALLNSEQDQKEPIQFHLRLFQRSDSMNYSI